MNTSRNHLLRILSSPPLARFSSSSQPGRSAPLIFDTNVKALQKARASLASNATEFDYLRDEVARRVVDRVCDMARTFPRALDLFCGSGHVLRALQTMHNKPAVRWLAHADVHPAILKNANTQCASLADAMALPMPSESFLWKEEDMSHIPISPGSLDLVTSVCGLQWVNDLPGVLSRVRSLLRPDGLFIGAMYGGQTLRELRIAMQLAEEEHRAGVSPHISPMVHMSDAGSVLGRAGFVLTTVDIDQIVVPFKDMPAVMRHLKGMGENNAVRARKPHYGRQAFSRAAEIYQDMFGYIDDQSRPCVPATFEILHMVGWAPADPSIQPQPSRRGSGTASLSDLSQLMNSKP